MDDKLYKHLEHRMIVLAFASAGASIWERYGVDQQVEEELKEEEYLSPHDKSLLELYYCQMKNEIGCVQ